MIQASAFKAMTPRVAPGASHVALRQLGHDRRPGGSRAPEVQSLRFSGSMIQVESTAMGSAVSAPMLALEGVEPLTPFTDVAIRVGLVRSGVRSIPRCLALLVALPRLWRVVGLATCHSSSLPHRDYWGLESLGTAQMPGEAA